jgi:hypothetical protein
MDGSTIFARELDFYERHKAEYLKTFPRLFVLIKGEQMLGPFQSAEDAYTAGLHTFGLTPFLVKQVLEHEPVMYMPFFSRVHEPDAGL